MTSNGEHGSDAAVLIVEDDAPLREIMQLLLEDVSRPIIFADSGRSALQALEKHQPNLIVIDLGLPDMHGFDLAKAIRARSGAADLRLIAFTGYDSATYRREATEAGFDDYLPKPMDLNSMEAVFARILGDVSN